MDASRHMHEKGTVLVVDDDRALCRLLEATLGERGYLVLTRTSGAEALDVLARGRRRRDPDGREDGRDGRLRERAVTLARYDRIGVDELPSTIGRLRPMRSVFADADGPPLAPPEDVEWRYIVRVLEHVRGNRTLAARVLGVDRKTLVRRLKQHGVESA